jgi:surface carbohydrate biosynthesis protein
MNATKGNLLLPIENQVRELDPRLLLACVAANRGFTSVIGPLREIEFRIAAFPRSIYLSKSMLPGRTAMFKIMRQLGLKIVTLDEEALVHLPAAIYYSRRLSPDAMSYVSRLFAWGRDNAELWRQYPLWSGDGQIHVTGNPRNDMLRPEIRCIYESKVKDLRRHYGDFILVNTNFNHVNAFYPSMNLFQPQKTPGEKPVFGRAAKGMTPEYAEGLRNLKQAVFEDFQNLIPELDRAFPDLTIVVRPHPTENQDIYRQIASRCKRVQVTNEGNVVPWLMATRALIHNGCTTGVESYLLGIPAISYRATVNEQYDDGFFRLPNRLSHQCFNFDQLHTRLQDILSGRLGVLTGDQPQRLIEQHLVAQDGPFACDRIVDVCESLLEKDNGFERPSLRDRIAGRFKAIQRGRKKKAKSKRGDSHLQPDFQRHRYPDVTIEEIRERVSRLQQLVGGRREVRAERIYNRFFRISAA